MKNIDYVSKIVSKNNHIPESLVKKVNSFFWKDVSKKIYAHEETALFIREIGTIMHSLKKIRTEILELVKCVRIIRKTTKFHEGKRRAIEEQYLKYLRKLLKQHNELAVLYNNKSKLQKLNRQLKNEQVARTIENPSESNS